MRELKIFLTFLMLALMQVSFTSCSDDKDEPSYSVPQSQTMTVGNTLNLKVGGTWTSSNSFVATVGNAGIVKAEHVGECTVSNGKQKCRITVSPTSNFITEPILKWGISKSEVISICGKDYLTSGDAIGYSTGISKSPLIMYMFTNNKLSGAAITVSVNYTESLVDFLLERYAPVAQDGYDFFFANGLSKQQITTFVGLKLFNKDYWSVMYMPYNDSRNIKDDDNVLESMSAFMLP